MRPLWGLALGVFLCSAAPGNRPAVTEEQAVADTVSLHEIVVTGARDSADVRHLPMTVSVIGRERLTEQHLPNILPTVMQQVPGLFVTSRAMMGYGVSTGSAGGISLRGIAGSAGQLMVLVDGHPQYNGVYGHPIADSYQTLMAERVEVVRGPASVLYGSNAMGGVVNIVTRGFAVGHDTVSTHLSLSAGSHATLQAEGSNQVRHGRFFSTVAAQYGRTDNHRPNMGFEQYGGYAKLGYDITSHWRAYADLNVTHFNASNPGPRTAPLYGAQQWITRGVSSLVAENHYGRTSGAVSVYSNFGRHKIDDGTTNASSPTVRYFRSRDNLAGLSLYQSTQLFKGNRLTLGLDYQHIYGHAWYTSKATGETLTTPGKQSGKSHRNETAAYIDFRQTLAQWITLDAGLRLDHHSITGTEWIPQAGIVLRPMETGQVKLLAGKGFRNPTMRELYLYPPSNLDLKPERIWNYEASWRHRVGPVTYGANIFYLRGDNLIQTVAMRNVNTGKVENCGAELEASWRVNRHWQLTTNHAYLHMEHPTMAAPEYSGFIGANATYGQWSAVGNMQYIHNLYTAVGANPAKENFCLLNVTLGYQVCRQANLWIRGENLLAQHYEVNQGFPMPHATVMAGINVAF